MQSSEHVALALEAAEMGTWEWDVRSNRVQWSLHLGRIHGSPEGVLPGTFEEYQCNIHPDDRAQVLSTIERTLQDRQPHRLEYRIVRPDGAVRWLHARGRLIEDANGAPERLIGVCMDVTAQREREGIVEASRRRAETDLAGQKDALSPDGLERSIRHAMQVAASERERRDLLAREQAALAEARTANRAKDEFLAALSHELRTPLNSILGWTHLLTSGTLDPATAPRALEIIQRNGRLQAKLIDDLLDVSRIVAGTLTVERRPVAIGAIVGTAVDSERPTAAAAQVELRYSAPDRDRLVLGDQVRLQQVVSNLLSNALKFTPAGGRVDVTLGFGAAGGILTVRDSGVGIAPDFLPHVFEQFRQADVTTTRRQGGLGLGLAIVRRIVELHDGSIHAQSAGPGTGATFVVTLPLAMAASAAAASGTRASADLAGLSILVVDDDADGRSFVATVLEECGARVRTASSRAMALDAAAAERPDVLLSDIAMPDGDGYSLVARFRALQPGVPAIAVTACVSPEDRLRAASAGFAAHVPKPVDPAALVSTILAVRPSTSFRPT
jgi:PAS domain S-box-containing protein